MRSSSIYIFPPPFLFPLLTLSLLLTFFAPTASALRILVAPTTTTNAPTTVYWLREPTDPQPLFDLRFVAQQDGVDVDDVGLAAANINLNVDGTIGLKKEEVRFPHSGSYVLKAVAGPTFQVIGTSNEVVVSPPGASTRPSPTTTSSPTSTATSAPLSGSKRSKTRIVIGAVLGSLIFLGILLLLLLFLLRRRREEKKLRDRLSFHPEDMVQRRRSKWANRLSLRVTPQGGVGGGAASAPVGGSFGSSEPRDVEGGSTENPFATPTISPSSSPENALTLAGPSVTASHVPVLSALNPSIVALRSTPQRGSQNTLASRYSQDSGIDVDVEAATGETAQHGTEESVVPPTKRRSGAWTMVEQALANVKRRASMISRSSSILSSRAGSPLPVQAPVSAAPVLTTTGTAPLSISAKPTATDNTSTSALDRDMAERAGKRVSVLPLPIPSAPLNPPPKALTRALPPVPLGPAFDVISVLTDDGKLKWEKVGAKGHKTTGSTTSFDGSTASSSSVVPPSTISTECTNAADKDTQSEEFKQTAAQALSEKARGKQRSFSFRPLPSTAPSPLPTIPASPATHVADGRPASPALNVRRALPTPVVSVPATESTPKPELSTRPLPSPLPTGGAPLATLSKTPTTASLRALPPLPPTPATPAFPMSASASAAPYTPSFPVPQVPVYPLSAAGVPTSPFTPGFDVPRTPTTPTVQRTPSYTRDTQPPPPLRAHTTRQKHIEHRIGQVKVQMRLLKRKMDSKQVDEAVGRRVVRDLEKQLAWLELHLDGEWAREVEGAVKPEEWGRYMK